MNSKIKQNKQQLTPSSSPPPTAFATKYNKNLVLFDHMMSMSGQYQQQSQQLQHQQQQQQQQLLQQNSPSKFIYGVGNVTLDDSDINFTGSGGYPSSMENINPYTFNSNAEYQLHLKQQKQQQQLLQQYQKLQQQISASSSPSSSPASPPPYNANIMHSPHYHHHHHQHNNQHQHQLQRQPSLPILLSTPVLRTSPTPLAQPPLQPSLQPHPLSLSTSSVLTTPSPLSSGSGSGKRSTTPKSKLTHSKSVSSFNTPTQLLNSSSNSIYTPLSAPPSFLPTQHHQQTLSTPSNRHKIRKAPSFSGYSPSKKENSKILDFKLIMEESNTKEPNNVVALELPNYNIQSVNNDRFEQFDKLNYLDLNNNIIQFNLLSILPNLVELYLSNNFIQNLDHNGFFNLTKLDLSHNLIDSNHVTNLMKIPKLVCLNLSYNNIKTLPESMAEFGSLETLYLEYNQLVQKNTMESLSTIPNLRLLNLSGNQWDRILPINGCFKSLVELSLCNNSITNLLNIGNIYHTAYPLLTRVQLWGNPLKSTSINFQVSKTIQLIIDQPPVQTYQQQQQQQQSPTSLSNSQILALMKQQQQLKQPMLVPFTYPPKEKKKQATSPLPMSVGGGGGIASSSSGKLSSSSYTSLQQHPGQPFALDGNTTINTNIGNPYYSPKLNASEPIFYRSSHHYQHHSDSEYAYEPFTPYKPPPPQLQNNNNNNNTTIEQPLFYLNQQDNNDTDNNNSAINSIDDSENTNLNVTNNNNNNTSILNNTTIITNETIDKTSSTDNKNNKTTTTTTTTEENYVQSSFSQLQIQQQQQQKKHFIQSHKESQPTNIMGLQLQDLAIEDEEDIDFINEEAEMEFYGAAGEASSPVNQIPNYYHINTSNNEIVLPNQ